MTVRSEPLNQARPKAGALFGRYNTLHLGAVIGHALSYLTTLWFVQWLPGTDDLRLQGAAAYILEVLLFALKLALYAKTPEGRGVGWAGVSADGLINMGGLLPYASAILSFPPVAVMLGLVGWLLGSLGVSLAWAGVPFVTLPFGDAAIPVSLSVLIVALGGGILLSAAPQKLWSVAEGG